MSDSEPSRITQGGIHSSKAAVLQSRALSVDALSPTVRKFVEENAKVLQPKDIYVCDGTQTENNKMIGELVQQGRLKKLKYDNW